jgi:hypothetical protein
MNDCTLHLHLADHDTTERGARIVLRDGEVLIEHMGDDRGERPTDHLDPATVNALRWLLLDRG